MELQSKFIEGTNEQYSIRNDGVVIRHYFYQHDLLVIKNKYSRMKILDYNITENDIKIRKCVKINLLVATTFSLFKFHPSSLIYYKLIHKNGMILDSSINNLDYVLKKPLTDYHLLNEIEKKEKIKKRLKENRVKHNYKEKYKEYHKEYSSAYHQNNKSLPEYIEKMRLKNSFQSKNITKNYIANQLSINVSTLTEEVYLFNKALLQIKRLLSQKLNCSIQTLK